MNDPVYMTARLFKKLQEVLQSIFFFFSQTKLPVLSSTTFIETEDLYMSQTVHMPENPTFQEMGMFCAQSHCYCSNYFSDIIGLRLRFVSATKIKTLNFTFILRCTYLRQY